MWIFNQSIDIVLYVILLCLKQCDIAISAIFVYKDMTTTVLGYLNALEREI